MSAIRRLTVLYDADCGLCRWVRRWLEREPQLVPLEFVPCGSAEARRRFPALDHGRTREEVTVVADTGEVWTADGAWIACLWATAAHRGLADRLSRPALRPTARRVALGVAALRRGGPPPAACTDEACPTGGPAGG
jgi:predicted DCC family thiol-disulfide oxidoreductase YuxK